MAQWTKVNYKVYSYHGEVIEKTGIYKCSLCWEEYEFPDSEFFLPSYCPNCGDFMNTEVKQND